MLRFTTRNLAIVVVKNSETCLEEAVVAAKSCFDEDAWLVEGEISEYSFSVREERAESP